MYVMMKKTAKKMMNNGNRIQDCDCGLREEFEKIKQEKERECQAKLQECRKSFKEKDRQMNDLKKKQTWFLVLIVVVATILGKETVDKITSWLESLNSLKSGVEQFTSQAEEEPYEHRYHSGGGIVPAPGAIALLTLAGVAGVRRRRR